MDEQYIIRWNRIGARPEEASYVLVKLRGKGGQIECCACAYEGGRFRYYYDRDAELVLEERDILGWSYYPYDEH